MDWFHYQESNANDLKELHQNATKLCYEIIEEVGGIKSLQLSLSKTAAPHAQKVRNKVDLPQYYVENSHPAIIDPETFDLVQLEMKKRKEVKGYKTGGNCFSGKIVCGE